MKVVRLRQKDNSHVKMVDTMNDRFRMVEGVLAAIRNAEGGMSEEEMTLALEAVDFLYKDARKLADDIGEMLLAKMREERGLPDLPEETN